MHPKWKTMTYKIIALFYAILFFLKNCNLKPSQNTAYDIIIVWGQSNAHWGSYIDKNIDFTNGNIYQLGRFSLFDHVIIPANEPLQHHTIQDDKNGFALTFSKIYDENNNKNNPILIILCGYGGTSVSRDWHENSFLYRDLINRTKFILEKFPNSQLKLMLWHQGEADVGNNNYDILLDDFIQNIRADLFNENLPFIVGGMVPYWVNQSNDRITQQNIIKNTPLRVENTAYADPEVPFIIEKTDNTFDEIHFSAEGQRELGKRYFNAYLGLIK